MTINFDFSVEQIDQNLVFDFFRMFSMLECALKREGFLRSGKYNAAEPDWKKFGRSISGRFKEVRLDGFLEAVSDMKAASPRRQVVRNNNLDWEDVLQQQEESEEEFVIKLTKTVRNNLFHGGKYPYYSNQEFARNKIILKAALKIIEGCYELHPGIANWKEAIQS